MISLIVLNYNDAETTISYVESVKDYTCFSHIVIVDNCSTDDSFEKLSHIQSEKCHVIKSEKNGGYGYGNNFGVKYLKEKYNPDYIVISNPDVRYSEDAIRHMESVLDKNKDISVIAPVMHRPNGNKDPYSAWKIPTGWQYALRTSCFFNKLVKDFFYGGAYTFEKGLMNVGAVAGSLFMARTADYISVKGFDENMFLYCEETVLGIKMMNAQKRVVLCDEKFTHFHSVTISKNIKKFKDREKAMWASRKYVLKSYYGFDEFKMIIVGFVEFVTVFSKSVAHAIKK